ncbi:MAG: T9SS type A sorting domain-containing protein [Chitinophagales bacterium]
MKKLVLLAALFCFLQRPAKAQVCTPMWVDTGFGINPDTILNLPPAYAGSPYDAVVQFKTPESALYYGSTINIDHVVLTGVDGLSTIPASVPFYFQCNPSGCSFQADSVGCVRIQGTPATPGTYDLIIQANVFITAVLFLPFPTPGYRIIVNNPIAIPAISQTQFDVSQNLPNPVTDNTNIYVNLPHAGKFTLRISNMVGTEVLKHEEEGMKGRNIVTVQASGFEPGIYQYKVSHDDSIITRRMVVFRR